MAVETRRGCGYRKIGGLYLVSGPGGQPCDRLPFLLDVCPTCGHGVKQTRGWTWVDLNALVEGHHRNCRDQNKLFGMCPMCTPELVEAKTGLLWIGEKFYHTVHDFSIEAARLGVSRRIKAIPRDFELGKTWILLAHPRAVWSRVPEVTTWGPDTKEMVPGIFMIWKPKRIEKILPASKRDSTEAAELSEKGITCVFVPDNDPDHQGVYENETDDQLDLINEQAAMH